MGQRNRYKLHRKDDSVEFDRANQEKNVILMAKKNRKRVQAAKKGWITRREKESLKRTRTKTKVVWYK